MSLMTFTEMELQKLRDAISHFVKARLAAFGQVEDELKDLHEKLSVESTPAPEEPAPTEAPAPAPAPSE
jgi:hypothetical protein